MATIPAQRLRTGEGCEQSGEYVFDGYADEVVAPPPGFDELQISLEAGDTFPGAGDAGWPCYWRPVAKRKSAGKDNSDDIGFE